MDPYLSLSAEEAEDTWIHCDLTQIEQRGHLTLYGKIIMRCTTEEAALCLSASGYMTTRRNDLFLRALSIVLVQFVLVIAG